VFNFPAFFYVIAGESGRGSDIMVPMAIPTFGGMAICVVSMLVVPVLYCAVAEIKLRK
jgi:Cu(I)/Ag(I) efflux system membrane protein CusA/SilA